MGDIDCERGNIKNISEIHIFNIPSSAKMVIRENDIIRLKVRPSRGAISWIDKPFDSFIASTGFALISKVKDEIIYFMLCHWNQLWNRLNGIALGAPPISQEPLQKVLILFPPQEIQIAALVDQA